MMGFGSPLKVLSPFCIPKKWTAMDPVSILKQVYYYELPP